MPKTAARRVLAPRPTTLAPAPHELRGEGLGEASGVRTLGEFVACNPATPPARLGWLFLHGDDQVRAAMARHPDCPLIVLEMLAGDDDERLQDVVANHPRCPVALREALTLRERQRDTRE